LSQLDPLSDEDFRVLDIYFYLACGLEYNHIRLEFYNQSKLIPIDTIILRYL